MSSTFRRRVTQSRTSASDSALDTKTDDNAPTILSSSLSHPSSNKTTASVGNPDTPIPLNQDTLQTQHSVPTTTTLSRMSTVFNRAGTKPWTGGTLLTSSGLRDWDVILGGGQPLGTAILVEEDRWTQDISLALVRYWAAEAIAQTHSLIVVATKCNDCTTDMHDIQLDQRFHDFCHCNKSMGMSPQDCRTLLHLLPRNLHWDKTKTNTLNQSFPIGAKKEGFNESTLSSDKIKRDKDDVISFYSTSKLQDFEVIQEDGMEDDLDDYVDQSMMDDDDRMEKRDGMEDSSDELLQNAWQYKLSVQRERSGLSNTVKDTKRVHETLFCHSYDLSGEMIDQISPEWIDENKNIVVANCCDNFCISSQTADPCPRDRACSLAFFHSCRKHIDLQLQSNPSSVVRLLLVNAPANITAEMLPLLITYIRVNSLPVVLLITLRTWMQTEYSPASRGRTWTSVDSVHCLRESCDAVFACEGFSAFVVNPPSEFSDLSGFFHTCKVASAIQCLSHFSSCTTSRRPPTNRYGIKRDRRKLHIQKLHLPPEDHGSSLRATEARNYNQSKPSFGESHDINNGNALRIGCTSNRSSTQTSRMNNSNILDF